MEGIVPLYYEMSKAKDSQITKDSLYQALTSAYKANIGIISNEITKIWNSNDPNVNAVKWLCMYNNFVIDFAKTLYLPEKPEHVDMELKKFSKNKLPHFFIYAKDKLKTQVNGINDSTVNKLEKIIPNKPIRFKNVAGNYNYKDMMNNRYPFHDLKKNEKLIEVFMTLNKNKHSYLNEDGNDENGFINMLKEQLNSVYSSDTYIVDVLIYQLFVVSDSSYKDTLWKAYGDIIYYNLLANLKDTMSCENCSSRIIKKSDRQVYCEECSDLIKKEKTRERVNRHRKK